MKENIVFVWSLLCLVWGFLWLMSLQSWLKERKLKWEARGIIISALLNACWEKEMSKLDHTLNSTLNGLVHLLIAMWSITEKLGSAKCLWTWRGRVCTIFPCIHVIEENIEVGKQRVQWNLIRYQWGASIKRLEWDYAAVGYPSTGALLQYLVMMVEIKCSNASMATDVWLEWLRGVLKNEER